MTFLLGPSWSPPMGRQTDCSTPKSVSISGLSRSRARDPGYIQYTYMQSSPFVSSLKKSLQQLGFEEKKFHVGFQRPQQRGRPRPVLLHAQCCSHHTCFAGQSSFHYLLTIYG